jgi:precorrin-2 dehydrogenase/sirohydrochlorin ferrochelatase
LKGYPVFLVGLEDRHCVVIGGGPEAERKVAGLLDCDAQVTVIAERITQRLKTWADANRIEWTPRDFQPGDTDGAFLVIAENTEPDVSAQVWAEAKSGLVNVMDDIEHCNFIAGSVVKQGPLTIAISTNGCAPTLAVRLREKMQKEYGPEYGLFLELMRDLREPIARCYPDMAERKAIWYALVDSDILDLLRIGDSDRVLGRIEQIAGTEVFNSETTEG